MAEEKKYQIIITNETSQEEQKPVATELSTQNPTKSKVPVGTTNKQGTAALNGMVAVNTIKPYITQAFNFTVGNLELMTGSAELQRKAQMVSTIASDGMSIAMGFVAGGPVGGIINTAVTLVQKFSQMIYKDQQTQLEKDIEEKSLYYRSSRLGLANGGSRK